MHYMHAKLKVLTDIDMLLIFEKGIGEYFTQFIDIQKLIINIWKINKKIKNCHILISGCK